MMKLKMKLLILVVSLTLVKTQDSTGQNSTISINEEKDKEVRKAFQLLEEGQQKILLSKERNLVLVLGNTGSGKSTFIQWLFGDNEKLVAKPAGGTFTIEDGNHRISNETFKSKTLFPELVMDGSTNTAYYDCPGFSDTRDTSHDIAITYFIKRVADYAERVKLIFIVNFPSLSKGANRFDFMKLLTHATDLIKDVDKFRDSIAIVATKVDNSFVEVEDDKFELISDDVVINGIAEFLVEAKEALATDSSKVKYVQLINVFLLRNPDGSYDRIGIFRRPSRKGPLSKIPMLQSGKKHVLRILKRIVFASKSVEDFGYTISDRSKADIIYLTRGIDITVEDNLGKIGGILLDKYNVLVADVERKLNDFLSINGADVNANEEIETTNQFITLGIREISRLIGEINAMKSSPSQLPRIIRSALSNLKLDLNVNETLNNISKQGEYFDFLQLVSKQSFLIPKSWVLNWKNTAQNLSILNTKFQNYTKSIVEQVVYRVDVLFTSVGRLIYDHRKEIVERMKEKFKARLNNSIKNFDISEVSKMNEDLNEAVNVTSDLIRDIQIVNNLSALCERVGNIPSNQSLERQLGRLLHFLNDKNSDVKMRKTWAASLTKELVKISNLHREFTIFINAMIDTVNDRIAGVITNSMQISQTYYKKLANNFNSEINSFVDGSLSSSDPSRVQKLEKEINKGYSLIAKLIGESVHVTNTVELADKISSLTSALNIDPSDEEMTKVDNYLSYLTFLLKVNNETFSMQIKWVKIFQATANVLSQLGDNCQLTTSNLTLNVKNSISHLTGDLGHWIRQHYTKLDTDVQLKMEFSINGKQLEEVDPIGALAFRADLITGINTTFALTKYIDNLTNVTTLADEINQSVFDMKLGLSSADVVENVRRNCVYLNYLLIVSNEILKSERSWVDQLENTAQYLVQLGDKFEISLNDSIPVLERRIEVLIGDFGLSLSQHYAEKLKEAKIQLLNFTLNSTYFREIEVYKIKEMVLRLKDGLTIISNMRPALSDPLTLKRIIYQSISDIHEFRLSEIYMKNVSFQSQILKFLLMARNILFHSPQHWSSTIENVNDGFSTALKYFTNTVAKGSSAAVYSSILTDFNSVAKIIKNHCERTMFTSLDSVNACYLPLWNLSVESYHTPNVFTFLSDIVDNCLKKFDDIDDHVVNHVVKRIAFLEYVQALSDRDLLSVIPFMTFQPFDQVFKFVREGREWYYFLMSLSLRFSEYEMQKDVSRYNVADLEDWGKVNKASGRFFIDKDNFHRFLDKLTHIFIDDDIRSMEIREVHLAALDKVLETHFRSKYRAVCEKASIVLRGNFIKFSDFIDEKGGFKSPCPLFHTLNINIYAFKTLFVDRDLIGVGKGYRISMMAPRWEVIGYGRSVVLDGASVMGIGRFFINGAELRMSAINGGRVNIIELGQPSRISKP